MRLVEPSKEMEKYFKEMANDIRTKLCSEYIEAQLIYGEEEQVL